MTRPEILAPAGSMKAMEAAIKAGADAVYMGGSRFGARAYAQNPEKDEMIEAIHYVHLYGKKIYLTLNTLLKEEELDQVGDFLLPYYEAGLDGIIIQDPGVFSYVKRNFPGLALHASTQMNITDAASAKLLKEAGACRVVPARELSFEEIHTIKEETGLEIECFVHGALCYCYSGRCLMSSILGGRSGNRGRCAQPCRLPYDVADNKKGSYVLSPRDLCTISLIPQLVEAGIDSFKIEGRMKNPEYVATIVSIYRKYLDQYLEHPKKKYEVAEEDFQMLLEAFNRGGFTEGYYVSHNGPHMMSMERPNHKGMPLGQIEKIKDGKIYFHPAIDIHKGDGLEIEVPGEKDNITLTSPSDCNKGENFSLNARRLSDLRPGFSILRTGNPWMRQQLAENLLDKEKKIPVYGYAEFRIGKPAMLVLSLEDGRSYTLESGEVQLSQGRPITEEQVRKPLMQTGTSRFDFADLTIVVEEEAFFPAGAVKKLRREALEGLEQMLMRADDRETPEQAGNWIRLEERFLGDQQGKDSQTEEKQQEKDSYRPECVKDLAGVKKEKRTPELRVSVEEKEKIYEALDLEEVDGIYLPLEELSREERREIRNLAEKKKVKIYYAFPYVFRKAVKEQYEAMWEELVEEGPDGMLLRNIDTYAWVREKQQAGSLPEETEIVLDQSLYTYNKDAGKVYRNYLKGKVRQTYPLELTRKEMLDLELPDSELMVYGRIPLMVSAQCVQKSTTKCLHKAGYLTMKDRYDKNFYVRRHCRHCYNTLWNGVPLSLQGLKEELTDLAPASLRIHFTTEKKEDMKRILRTFYEEWNDLPVTNPMKGDFTRGHYKRGIE